MHSGVRIQLLDQGQQLGLTGVCRQSVLHRMHADFLRLTTLVAHIHLTGRVLADQHHRQTGGEVVFGLQPGDDLGQPPAQLRRSCFAIQNLRCHVAG